MVWLQRRHCGRAAAAALGALAIAGCLSPQVHDTATTVRRRQGPAATAPRRVEPATSRLGHVIHGPQKGYPTIPGAPKPYSDWEVPWDWTYGPVLESHRDGTRDLQRLERKLEDLERKSEAARREKLEDRRAGGRN